MGPNVDLILMISVSMANVWLVHQEYIDKCIYENSLILSFSFQVLNFNYFCPFLSHIRSI